MSKKQNRKKKRVAEQRRNIQAKRENKIIENVELKKEENKKVDKKKQQKIKEKKKKTKKVRSKKKIIIMIIVILIFAIILTIAIYLLVRPKFKDITIELGTEKISVNDFLVSNIYSKGAQSVTNLNEINLLKVGKFDVKLKFWNKEQIVTLNIVDTTAPKVKFQDVTAYLDYQINPEDFIETKEDFSEMTVELVDNLEIPDYGEYEVNIKVSDKYGNETVGKSTLIITWFLSDVKVELGSEFSVANVVVDAERFGSLVEQSEIDKVDTSKLRTI